MSWQSSVYLNKDTQWAMKVSNRGNLDGENYFKLGCSLQQILQSSKLEIIKPFTVWPHDKYIFLGGIWNNMLKQRNWVLSLAGTRQRIFG